MNSTGIKFVDMVLPEMKYLLNLKKSNEIKKEDKFYE